MDTLSLIIAWFTVGGLTGLILFNDLVEHKKGIQNLYMDYLLERNKRSMDSSTALEFAEWNIASRIVSFLIGAILGPILTIIYMIKKLRVLVN